MKAARRPGQLGSPTSSNGPCSRSCMTFVMAFIIALPLASIISMPLSLIMARQKAQPAEERLVAKLESVRGIDSSERALRGLGGGAPDDEDGYAGAGAAPSGWSVSSTLAGALAGEDIRIETVPVDFGDTRHYASLCDGTYPAEFLLGGLKEYERPPVMQFRGPDPSSPTYCASGNIFMVDMRDNEVADDLVTYLFREEPWSIELWVSILSATKCRTQKGLGRPHACRTNWGGVLAGRRPLVVDFGANHGFFGLIGARLGYDVVAVDPQPHCAEYVRVAAAASEFPPGRFTTVNAFLSKDGKMPDGAGTMTIPVRTGCWGTFPVGDDQARKVLKHFSKFPGGNSSQDVPVVDPLELIGAEESDVVVMMKIDTEGAEFGIMRALLPALRAGRILNMLVEINKGVTDESGQVGWPEWRHKEIIDTLTEVAGAGYVILCAQYGRTAAWSYSPKLNTRESITEFAADGWRAANIWITRDHPGDESLPEAS